MGGYMDEIVGRYKVRLDKDELVLTHPTGISFDLKPDESLRLADYILARKSTLILMQQKSKMRSHDKERREAP
jgi:hypothetical protein